MFHVKHSAPKRMREVWATCGSRGAARGLRAVYGVQCTSCEQHAADGGQRAARGLRAASRGQRAADGGQLTGCGVRAAGGASLAGRTLPYRI